MRITDAIFVAAAISGIIASLLAWGFASDIQRHQFLSMCWLRACDSPDAAGPVERGSAPPASAAAPTSPAAEPAPVTPTADSSSPPVPPIVDGSHWTHNGSLMYLRIDGSSRRIYYLQPRPGMIDAGARPDSLLFDGTDDNGHWSGSARIFSKRCEKQYPYLVEGGPRDNNAIVELTGHAPRIGPDCEVTGYGGANDDLIFAASRP